MYPIKKIKNELIKDIKNLLFKLNCKIDINLEEPTDEKIGDFAFPCFQLAPVLKKSPNEIAKKLKEEIKKNELVEKIEVKNGYLNFFLDEKKINKMILDKVFEKNNEYGFLEKKNKKVIVEHTSANPNGPLHVGRARNPIIGDTISRIYKAAGYDVETQFYLDDMGKQVAILSWGIENLKEKDIERTDRNKMDHSKVGYYQKATKLLKENPEISFKIQEIIKKSEKGDKNTIERLKKAYLPVLEGMKESLNRINIEIDKYVPESKFVENKDVNKVIEELKKSEYSDFEDGAYFIDMKPFGIKGRNTNFYYLRRDGTSLYATRDVAYHMWKAKKADILINILGEDHKLESKQVETALKIVKADLIPEVIFYSFVSLPGGKMSTRKNRVVYLDDLIDECVKRAYIEVKKRRGKELSDKKMKKISEDVGISALRYNIIKVQPEKSIVFKWEEALNFEGNAAPFIQYAHARAASILKKYNKELERVDYKLLTNQSEINLIRKIGEFPEIIEKACEDNKPHLIPSYLFELASKFNQFYRDCPVLHEENNKIKNARVFLVKDTKIVLKNGLEIIGIKALDEM